MNVVIPDFGSAIEGRYTERPFAPWALIVVEDMQPCDILIQAAWCVPVEPANTVFRDHAVVVTDGRIVDLLPQSSAREKYAPGATILRPDHILIPGLVNAHTHAAMTLFRGLADDLPLERWLRDGIWPAEGRWAGAEMVRDGTRHAIAEMLLSGCTCFSDQYFFPEVVAETAAKMHMRAMIGTPVIEFATAWSENAADCLAKGTDLVHDRYVDHSLIATCFAPHSVGTVTDESFRSLRVLADQLDRRIQLHLHETKAEIAESEKDCGLRPIARLNALGLINASLLAVHAVHLTDDEIMTIAAHGVGVAHCPRSNMKLADGIARVPDLLAAGVITGIGTDGAASNNVLDMLGEMRAAALLAKVSADDATAVPAATALRMATLNGAATLGLAECIGSIESGKWADLACIDLMHLNSQPVYDPLSQLVYTAQSQQVSDVWIAGRHQVAGGVLQNIDTNEILRRTSEWRDRIANS